jgi:hypothetical protein
VFDIEAPYSWYVPEGESLILTEKETPAEDDYIWVTTPQRITIKKGKTKEQAIKEAAYSTVVSVTYEDYIVPQGSETPYFRSKQNDKTIGYTTIPVYPNYIYGRGGNKPKEAAFWTTDIESLTKNGRMFYEAHYPAGEASEKVKEYYSTKTNEIDGIDPNKRRHLGHELNRDAVKRTVAKMDVAQSLNADVSGVPILVEFRNPIVLKGGLDELDDVIHCCSPFWILITWRRVPSPTPCDTFPRDPCWGGGQLVTKRLLEALVELTPGLDAVVRIPGASMTTTRLNQLVVESLRNDQVLKHDLVAAIGTGLHHSRHVLPSPLVVFHTGYHTGNCPVAIFPEVLFNNGVELAVAYLHGLEGGVIPIVESEVHRALVGVAGADDLEALVTPDVDDFDVLVHFVFLLFVLLS